MYTTIFLFYMPSFLLTIFLFLGRHEEGGFGGPPFGGEGGEEQGFGSFDSFDE